MILRDHSRAADLHSGPAGGGKISAEDRQWLAQLARWRIGLVAPTKVRLARA